MEGEGEEEEETEINCGVWKTVFRTVPRWPALSLEEERNLNTYHLVAHDNTSLYSTFH